MVEVLVYIVDMMELLPYSFLWSGPQNFNSSSQNLQNLSQDIYNLNLIDALNNLLVKIYPF